MILDCDLHIHGRFSMGTSRSTNFRGLARSAKRKGLHLVGTGDILHPEWRKELIDQSDESGSGIYEVDGISFVCTTEVEDNKRVHHVIIFPSIEAASEFASHLDAQRLESDGRPKLPLTGEEIAGMCERAGAIMGPSHAFTPWTAMYAYHDSIGSCYGSMTDYVSFVELGLSADSSYADRIAELAPLVFLSNSDSHSAGRIAREFNRIRIDPKLDFPALKKALSRNSDAVVANAGFYPQEGKYNESACIRCHKHYTLEEAVAKKWKCTCGRRIKKGVRDRVNELATSPEPHYPSHRGKYIHVVPIETLVALGLDTRVTSKKVETAVERLVSAFGNEINVLLNVKSEEIGTVVGSRVGRVFRIYRQGKMRLIPGGGGEYGRIELPD